MKNFSKFALAAVLGTAMAAGHSALAQSGAGGAPPPGGRAQSGGPASGKNGTANTPQSPTQNPALKSSSAQESQRDSNRTATTPGSGMGSGAGTGAGTGAAGSAAQLEPGANSFTENQARSRMTDAGYSDITELAKDDNGIWRAKAKKDGKTVTLGLDYKGNIAPQ